MNWLDPLGASLSLICTYYFSQAKKVAWALGILAIFLNSILYWQKGIYGYLLLEAVYLVSMIYGWYTWSHKNHAGQTRLIRSLKRKEALWLTILALIAIFFLAHLLKMTDSTIPYWDASTTVLSLLAQWLLCIKVIECWLLWFIVDAMVGGVQFYKGIPFHSAIHWLYLILAIVGFFRWRKLYATQHIAAKQDARLSAI